MASTEQPRSQTAADPSRPWLQSSTGNLPSSQLPSSDLSQPQQPTQLSSNSKSPTVTEALASIKPSDFLTIHQKPCARPGLLTGIGAGAVVGILRFIIGAPVPKAANWAVGTAVVGAIGQYEYCQYQRRQEKEKVKRVVQVYAERARKEKEERERKEREERERREREEREKAKKWWRFW